MRLGDRGRGPHRLFPRRRSSPRLGRPRAGDPAALNHKGCCVRYSVVSRCTIAIVAALFISAWGEVSAQPRRRPVEPPQASQPIPPIASETAACSYAYYSALAPVRDGSIKELGNLDRIARANEPGLPGKWLFWSKTGKNASKPPQPERVCAQSVPRSGRERCVEWETKPVDPVKLALFAAQPTADELTVLRALDAFVADRGAALEFGSNGRQYATLQRVAIELGSYSTQPKNPALCNGVPEMLDFKAGKLDGLKKRIDDVSKVAVKARALARQRVTAAREIRLTEQTAVAQANAVGEAANAAPSVPRLPGSTPVGLAATVSIAGLITGLLEGTVPVDKANEVRAEPNALKMLQRARDLMTPEASPALSPASRAASAAALRMIEAASYSELQVAHIQRFDRLFLGTIGQIREAHRVNCTCGG